MTTPLQAASVDDSDTDCYAIGVDLIHNLHATAFHQIRESEERVRSLLVIGGVTEETSFPAYEQAELQRFCQRLGAEISCGGLDLLVCSPFADSADFHALQGYLGEPSPGAVQLHIPRHARIEGQLEQLLLAVGPAAASRIRNWHYPGPEQDTPEAWGQAWLFCQLMALERADAVIAVGGKAGKTASTILHLAEARRQPIVPFSFLGGAAERAFRRRDWARTFPWLNVRHLQDRDGANHAVYIASQMVARRVATVAPNLAPPSRVFISRARMDEQFGLGLEELLVQRGLTIMFGEHTLPADRTIEAAIEDAVLGADLFIALWSRSYAASRYCFDEIVMALERFHAGTLRLWIINLDGSDVIPPRARGIPQILAKTPNAVVGAVNDLLNELRPGQ